MFNLSETAKISCHYEPFTTAGAIFREMDRTNFYSLCIPNIISLLILFSITAVIYVYHTGPSNVNLILSLQDKIESKICSQKYGNAINNGNIDFQKKFIY